MKRVHGESPTIRSYRELLGVGPTTDTGELKRSYHRLALLYHPDRNPNPNAASEFQKVREAYEVLTDPLLVHQLNHSHLRERLFNNIIEGLNICFGSFFGYRIFNAPQGRITREFRIGSEKSSESDLDSFERIAGPLEQDSSILDNSAYDNLEIVYAGKFSVDDEERLQSGMDGKNMVRLPWVLLNNQGILHFLDGDTRKARKCYQELNERIPNNIIFMYRLGLCHIIEGFKNPKRTLLGFAKPDRREIEIGLRLLRHCIHIGETRQIGKQRCLVIRKTLADVLEKTGRRRQALKIWREIHSFAPQSIEATLKTKGLQAAREALAARKPAKAKDAKPNQTHALLNRGRTRDKI